MRTTVIFVVLGAFVYATGKWQDPTSLPHRSLLFLTLSGLATGASWVCYFRALKLGEAYRVAPIDKLSVVLMAIFAVAFLGERPAPRDWVGIVCVGVGVLLLSLKNGKTCAPPASSGKEVANYFICGVISRSDLRSEGR